MNELSTDNTSARLTVIIPSSFIQGQIPKAGSRVEFIYRERESQQVLYQLYKDGQELQGQDNSSLILNPLKVQHFGFCKCEVRSD